MRTRSRTSTMIALRARRQAWNIASDIANPHVDVPPPAPPSATIKPLLPPYNEIACPSRHDVPLLAGLRDVPRWAEWLIAIWAILMVVSAVLIFSLI